MSDEIEDVPVDRTDETPPDVIEGAVDNGSILPVAFPFYTGPAGVRDRGNGRVEFAFFRPAPFYAWRPTLAEGAIGGVQYRVVNSKVSDMTKAMIVVTAQRTN